VKRGPVWGLAPFFRPIRSCNQPHEFYQLTAFTLGFVWGRGGDFLGSGGGCVSAAKRERRRRPIVVAIGRLLGDIMVWFDGADVVLVSNIGTGCNGRAGVLGAGAPQCGEPPSRRAAETPPPPPLSPPRRDAKRKSGRPVGGQDASPACAAMTATPESTDGRQGQGGG
jgi:hypothetical protein